MRPEASEQLRASLLGELGAREEVLRELLEYNRNVFDRSVFEQLPALPLADEPHLEAWREYAAESAELGVLPALRRRLVQLCFPIEAGISESEPYRAATRRGQWPAPGGELELEAPERITLELHPTQAGTIPVLVADARTDFERLVQALTFRNEPKPVPASMGACIVSGLNNWDRVARLRRAWEERQSGPASPAAWSAEFQRLMPNKALYQDRLIVLSIGAYSAVSSGDMGIEEDEWLARSLIIRRDHECAHYFTLRVLGSMRNNLIDELIADYVGLVAAFGRYDGAAALRFLGVGPGAREGGRIHNYRGKPPLSDAAFAILGGVVEAAVERLQRFNAEDPAALAQPPAVARTILALAQRTLEELASDAGSLRVEEIQA